MTDPSGGAARVACPRCRANNFAGKTQCWQCAATLPPPEAVTPAGRSTVGGAPAHRPAAQHAAVPPGFGPPPSMAADPATGAFVRKWGMSPGTAAALVAIGLGAFLLVWTVGGYLRGGAPSVRSGPAPAAQTAPPVARDEPAVQPADDSADPIVEESKRFIDRESRHAGLPEPPAASDGRVYLRGGGSITGEQYRDAQRRVRESPVMHAPLPAPPMP